MSACVRTDLGNNSLTQLKGLRIEVLRGLGRPGGMRYFMYGSFLLSMGWTGAREKGLEDQKRGGKRGDLYHSRTFSLGVLNGS